jgi:predicted secreted protein
LANDVILTHLTQPLVDENKYTATRSRLKLDAPVFVPKAPNKYMTVMEPTNTTAIGSQVLFELENEAAGYDNLSMSHIGSNNDASQEVITAVVQQLRRPKQEIKKFGGNPMEYKRFIRQFEACIVANTHNDEERMAYLDQFTLDEAHKIVVSYAHLDAKYGYSAALRELEERYGNSEHIANAFIKRALEWPPVRDSAKALDDFAIILTECEHAANSIQAICILDYSENIKRMIAKLPFYLHDRWRNFVQQIKGKDEIVKFKHLVEFIKKEAKKLNDPVYGKEALCGQENRSANSTSYERARTQRPRASCATRLETEEKSAVTKGMGHQGISKCPCCQETHALHLCGNFRRE